MRSLLVGTSCSETGGARLARGQGVQVGATAHGGRRAPGRRAVVRWGTDGCKREGEGCSRQ